MRADRRTWTPTRAEIVANLRRHPHIRACPCCLAVLDFTSNARGGAWVDRILRAVFDHAQLIKGGTAL